MHWEAVARVFHQVEHFLKASIATIVRAWHHRAIRLLTKLS